jgi:hypothetical protein
LSYNHGNVTVDVANSYLKDDVSLESILGKLPGLIVEDRGGISMFGKTKLQIYINNMKAGVMELKSLQPLDVDKIEVIRNVGAEYDADIDGVIRIWTRKKRSEKIFVSLNDNVSIRHYLSNKVNLSMYIGHNEKFSQLFTYDNFAENKRDHSRSYTYIYFDDYRNCNFRDDYSIKKNIGHGLSYSLNWSISKDKELVVHYGAGFSENVDNINGLRHIYHDEELNKTVDLNSKATSKSPYNSTVNVGYKQKINDISELSVIADYVVRNGNATTDITESSIDRSANNILDTDIKGRVFSINPEYKIKQKKYTGNIGLKYSYLNSYSETEFRPAQNDDYSRVSEHTGGAYMLFGANLSSVDIKSGLRLEYTGSDIQYKDMSNNLIRNYLNLFPHISVSKKFNKHLSLTAYYKRTISRPSIPMLRTTVYYRDSLHYSVGNPRLKPEITDAFNFNVNYRGFDFSLGYSINKDETYYDCFTDSSNPNRMIATYGNVEEKNKVLTALLSYSFNNPVFGSITSITYMKYDLSLLFNDEIIRFNRPRYTVRHSGNLKFLKNTRFNYSFEYRTPGDGVYMQRTSSWYDLNAGINQHLLDGKLMLAVSVFDILKTYGKRNRWTSYSNNIAYRQDDNWPDTRYVYFTVRYSWGKNKSIQRKTSDTDHINRL